MQNVFFLHPVKNWIIQSLQTYFLTSNMHFKTCILKVNNKIHDINRNAETRCKAVMIVKKAR